MKTRVIRVGNSKGILLPKHVIEKLRLEEGDSLYLTIQENPPGMILRRVEDEAAVLGLTSDDRKEIDDFIEMYQSIIRSI